MLNLRAGTFSNRVINGWNKQPENVVNAPSRNALKLSLNRHSQCIYSSLKLHVIKTATLLEHIEMHLYKSMTYTDVEYCELW